jgi:hypothetical protein
MTKVGNISSRVIVVSVSELTKEDPAKAILPVTWAVNTPNRMIKAEVSTKPATQLNKKPAGPSLIKKELRLNLVRVWGSTEVIDLPWMGFTS